MKTCLPVLPEVTGKITSPVIILKLIGGAFRDMISKYTLRMIESAQCEYT